MSSQSTTEKCRLCDRNITRSNNLKRHLTKQHNVHQNRVSNFFSEAEDNEQKEDDQQEEDSDDLIESDFEETQEEQYDSENALYYLLRDRQKVAGDVDEEQADQDISMIESVINEQSEWNHLKSATFPFANIESMIMHALVEGDNDRCLKSVSRWKNTSSSKT
ncbi:uncharacterized protein B0P05DRAFT_570805 [Gilbertella persicaria]|uniref:uncharacterized protein n=1 Tax=Gilbertella persicaria TaxID=101096 RepID=UPI00221FD7F8|nr:uncharacterized protein B0P05DRAFT_570805 [Gilbertella persicaria]KAI8082573.1 hypothetical protein B0P05DRAFT_570805 [Gilbertella persicaria]